MSVPPISSDSTDRLGRAAECADAMVDDGVLPSDALAKAAREESVPYGHIPILVRAFNTGRAARQLGETDPWAKAADHPVTTADAVYAALSKLDEPQPTEKAAEEYSRPPYVTAHVVPSAPTVPIRIQNPIPLFAQNAVKSASIRNQADPAGTARTRNLTLQNEAAKLIDQIRDRSDALAGPVYTGVKCAAAHACPRAADVFAFIEARHPFIARKAAAAPDPLVSTNHPVVDLVRQLDVVIAAYSPEPVHEVPSGCTKIAEDCDRIWYTRQPETSVKTAGDQSIAITVPAPFTLTVSVPTVIPSAKKQADDSLPPAAPSGIIGGLMNLPRSVSEYYKPRDGITPGTSGIRGAWQGFGSGTGLLTNNVLGRKAVGAMSIKDPDTRDSDPNIDTQVGKLKTDLGRIDTQSALQDVIADPRLARIDPKTVIQTYQTLSRLAPEAMSNPSIAADFIHRQVHTGPPTMFDIKQLVDIEKSLAQVKKYRTGQDAAEED
jgi:hypothetical protein